MQDSSISKSMEQLMLFFAKFVRTHQTNLTLFFIPFQPDFCRKSVKDMGLISPPKWPSVNPFSHPLGSKIGRKPMVNPSKWVNLKSNFLKFHHRNQAISGIEKARKMAYFRAFLALLSCRLSLAELRSATSCLEAVLTWPWSKKTSIHAVFRAFLSQ